MNGIRRCFGARGIGVVLPAALAALPAALLTLLVSGSAGAYSFVEEVSGDACDRARAFDITDDSPAAEHARRACRLQHFETRLAAERRQEQTADQEAREARVQAWLDATQSSRALRPLALQGYVSNGLTSYGLVFSWDVLRAFELDARVGQRQMTCSDLNSSAGADCTRTGLGLGARWFLFDKDVSPFLGTGFQVVTSHLQIIQNMPEGGANLLVGNGRANSLSGTAGLQLSLRGLRVSIEYVYEYVFYTGANAADAQKTPSEDLRVVWRDSLKQDRNGFSFQAGYAF